MPRRPHILVIGGASVDRLRAAGQPVVTPGGAALYTAVAAQRAGADVRLFAMRPDPLPDLFATAANTVDWVGPTCLVEDLPHFEIVYDDAGDARLERASWGREDTLDPAMLPDALLNADTIHIAAIHDPGLQMKFVAALRRRTKARLSAGTFGYMVHRAPDAVRALMESVDLFFLNAFEAEQVFGDDRPAVRPGQVLVITRGAQGADVWQGDHCTRVPCIPTQPVDLTGAGDSVCGGALAGLAAGLHPTEAVRLGAAVASLTIESPGMAGLLAADRRLIDHRRGLLRDPRVALDDARIERMGQLLRDLPDIAAFDFVGPQLPEVNQPGALDFFFSACLHQFGFWTPRNGAWDAPTFASWNQEKLKGSDYCFAAFRRVLDNEPQRLTPRAQATWRWSDTEDLFRDDDGAVPMPVLANHHALLRGYGRDMWELGWTPESLVQAAQASDRPVRFLLQALDHVTGYREDPLRKKSMLLALCLTQRPEKWLDAGDGRDLAPVVDYHVMRTCLRTGIVTIQDETLLQDLSARRLLRPADEAIVRLACRDAVLRLCAVSGRDLGAIDWTFFSARKRCPETTEPECAACLLNPVCAHQKGLFQPVVRTTFY